MGTLRAGAYCRVSTLSDKQDVSLSSQVKYYNDLFDNDPGLINAGVYIDQGISGRTITRRREFQRMLRDCREGKLDVVYCKSITRFGRNTLDTLQSIELLRKLGIPVIFEVENINTLTDKDFNTILMSYMAQDEVDKDIELSKQRLKRSHEQGKIYAWTNSLLGYDWDINEKKLKINPEGAKVVRLIFDLYIKGVETKEIARRLNNEGYRTVRGMEFDSSALIRIIHQEKYTGNLMLAKYYTDKYGMKRVNHGEQAKYFVENTHEAIISQEIFDKAQEICKSKRLCFNTAIKEYDPMRCIVFCGVCGKTCDRLQCNKIKNPKTRVSYRCLTVVKKGPKACANHQAVKIGTLKEGFIASFNKIKETGFNFNKAFSTAEADMISKEIDGLLQQERIYIQMNINGLMTDKLKKEYKKLVDRIMELQEEKKQIVNRSLMVNELTENAQIAKNIFDKYEKMTTFEDSDFSALIRRIVIHSRTEIEYFYKMGISVTVKVVPYLSIDDDIAEVIINDTNKANN